MRRGEIWWANLAAPVGPRPVVLLSRNVPYDIREFVTISTVSTKIRGIPAEVSLGSYEGLGRQSAVNLDVLYTSASRHAPAPRRCCELRKDGANRQGDPFRAGAGRLTTRIRRSHSGH